MKLLLDENLPTKLCKFFSSENIISTVADENWRGTKNGELLKLMVSMGFSGLVRLDKNLQYQQNLKTIGIRISILNAPNSKLMTLRLFIEALEIELVKLKGETVLQTDLA